MVPELPLLLLLLLLPLLPRGHAHHVVFEDVGQVAVSTSYLHAIVPFNMTGVRLLLHEHRLTLDTMVSPDVKYEYGFKHYDHETRLYFGIHWRYFMQEFVEDFKKYLGQMRSQSHHFDVRLRNLLDVLPRSQSSPPRHFPASDVVRAKRFLPIAAGIFGAVKGVFGTFMGLYNRRQLRQLQQDLQGVIRDQKRIIALMTSQSTGGPAMAQLQRELGHWVHKFRLFSPIACFVTLLQQELVIEHELRRITSAVQQAHLRRLSVDLLMPSQLSNLYDSIHRRAVELDAELLLERPSDLFQIEASYAVENDDVTLLLHVPIAARDTLLRLFRFHPFPLTFSKTHFLIPHSRHQLFAISLDASRLGLDLTEADLEGCYRLNGLHLCERLGVLHTRLARTCLGSLYDQKFKAALALCEMDLEPISERVLQLSNNWFLIYANASFTAGVRCRNNTANELHLKTGLNKVHISPTCHVQLQQHKVFSDTALRATSDIKEFEWDLEDSAFSEEEVQEADEVLAMIEPEGANKPTLAAVRRQTAQNKRSPKWLWFFIVVGFLALLGLALFLFSTFYARKWWLLRRAVRLLIHRVWNSVTDTPATTASAHVLGAASEPRPVRSRGRERSYTMPATRQESHSPQSSPSTSTLDRKKKKKVKGKRERLKARFQRAFDVEPPTI